MRVSALDDRGDKNAPVGSLPWARYFVLLAQSYKKDLDSDVRHLKVVIDKLESGEAWKAYGLLSFDMLCRKELGIDPPVVENIKDAQPGTTVGAVLAAAPELMTPGRPKKGNAALPFPRPGKGANNARLAARLKRDHPGICKRIEAGEFSSIRAAAVAAGIVKPTWSAPTDVEKLSIAIKKRYPGWIMVKQ